MHAVEVATAADAAEVAVTAEVEDISVLCLFNILDNARIRWELVDKCKYLAI